MGWELPAEAFKAPSGLRVSRETDGAYLLELEEPVGRGFMRGYSVSQGCFACVVDFWCDSCPRVSVPEASGERWLSGGSWMSVNYCLEGRCEVLVENEGYAMVKAGDCCVSGSAVYPQEYRYPLSRYRGVEVFVHTNLTSSDKAFSLLDDAGASLERMAREAGFSVVFSNDAELNGFMERMGRGLDPFDALAVKYEVLGFLLALARRDVRAVKPDILLTRAQVEMARRVHDEIEGALEASHDVRAFAQGFGVSASTLNSYFSDVYGQSIAAYARRRRMEEARVLLEGGAGVAEAASRLGYANPSKFGAAFKRAFAMTPSECRRRARL